MTIFAVGTRGGFQVGGQAPVAFSHGDLGAVADIEVLWDFDNDGDFNDPEENITRFVVSAETSTGRDFPSQLTGKASPGSFRALLRNDDARFSLFNESSPLETDGRSLDSGRKLRVRAVGAADPDPVLLAIDRFRRPDGPLTTTETGQAWEAVPAVAEFTVAAQTARATTIGQHLAVVNVGSVGHMVQARIGRLPIGSQIPDTSVGVVYRFVDGDNYSRWQIRADGPETVDVDVVDVVAGVETSTTVVFSAARFDGQTLGAHAHGSTVDLYLNGVQVGSRAASASGTRVGMFGNWELHIPPEVAELRVWDRATARTDGIVWTGDVDDVIAETRLGPNRTANLTGSGVLARMSTVQVQPPGVVDPAPLSTGLGKILADARLGDPYGRIAPSTLTGRIAVGAGDAIDVARRIEETEFGFLRESAEGWVDFDARDERIGRVPQAVFSDREGDQFGYRDIRPLSWRREIFNRVDATVAPTCPNLIVGVGHQATFPGVEFALVSVKPFIQPGDLLLGWAVCAGFANVDWHGKAGWEQLGSNRAQQLTGVDGDNVRMFARRADGTENLMPDFVAVASADQNVEFLTDLVVIRPWHGDIGQGIEIGDMGDGDPPPLEIPWYPDPTLLFVLRVGMSGAGQVSGWTEQGSDGYWFGQQHTRLSANFSVAMQRAHKRVAAVPVTDPAPFDGTFGGFTFRSSLAFAVRGYSGDPPGEGNVVRVDDIESQDRHNAVKSHVNPGDLFVDDVDAAAYGETVVATFGRRHPVVEITWQAHKGAAYRAQALRRRVGDMIYLRADGPTGQGIAGRFFIETISNRFSRGGTEWEVTWALSKA